MNKTDKKNTPLPCKCGAEVKLSRSPTGLTSYINCPKCGKHTGYYCVGDDAIKEWNKR